MPSALAPIASLTVALFGLSLIGFAGYAVVRPGGARRFLGAFASSARIHFTEQILRLVAGMALVLHAPFMRLPQVYGILGWLMLTTAVGLMLIPWRWHQKFAGWVVPPVAKRLKSFAVLAGGLGVFILWGLFG